MFKPVSRPSLPSSDSTGFAETLFLHDAGDDDYSGFAPTQLFDDALDAPARPAAAAHAAAATSRSTLERVSSAAVAAPAHDSTTPSGWATSRWMALPESRAHEAAHKARAVIAAQRRGDAGGAAPMAADRSVGRLLRGLLPLFIGVTVTVALISALLPLLDKP